MNILRLILGLLAIQSFAAEPGVSSNSAPVSTNAALQAEAVPTWSGTATNAHGESLARILVYASETPDLKDWGARAGRQQAIDIDPI
jgi:hypothetical protein